MLSVSKICHSEASESSPAQKGNVLVLHKMEQYYWVSVAIFEQQLCECCSSCAHVGHLWLELSYIN